MARNKGQLLLCLMIFLSSLYVVQCYNILFMLPFGSRSHKNVFDPVAQELGKRGHKVVMFSAIEEKTDPPGVTNVFCQEIADAFLKSNITFFKGPISSLSMFTEMFTIIYEMLDIVYTDRFVAELVKQPLNPLDNKPKFDVVVIDAVFNDFVLALGHHLGVPNIIFSPSTFFHHHSWNLNIPQPISYIPSSFSDFPDSMDFVNRALNTFSTMFFFGLMNYVVFPNEDEMIKKYIPNAPPLVELNKNVSFMLNNIHPALHVRKPGMPYTADVGGINCKEAKPLPKDLEDFMQKAGKPGVIYFSLGSVSQGITMPLDMRDKVIQVFSKLPQKIIWKYEKDIPSLPGNIKLVKWAPQQDILAHPQVKLFITHGGLLSTSEAAYHGCPILGFPLSADQLGNMVQARRTGVGDYLDWKTFTAEEFQKTIERLTSDQSYKENSQLSSVLLKDVMNRPVDVAVYWIEYVIRHKGAHFLKSSATHLNFFQYFLLDVLAVAIVALIVLGVMLFYITKYTCKLLAGICRALGFCSKSAPKKTKNKKKSN